MVREIQFVEENLSNNDNNILKLLRFADNLNIIGNILVDWMSYKGGYFFSLFINNIHHHLNHSQTLSFANNIRLFLCICIISETFLKIIFNSSFNDLVGVSLNLFKYKFMT